MIYLFKFIHTTNRFNLFNYKQLTNYLQTTYKQLTNNLQTTYNMSVHDLARLQWLAEKIMKTLEKDQLIADILKHLWHSRHMKKSDYDKIISDRLSRGCGRGTKTQFRGAVPSLKNNPSNTWLKVYQTEFGDIIHENNSDTIELSPTWRTAMALLKTTRK